MTIKELFTRDINRSINGVVKAEQLDDAVVWQELDEFVVTKELDQHLRRFFGAYTDAIDNQHDPATSGKIGVWMSGFFGSGKSHFLKVLSYVLGNRQLKVNGQTRQTVEFFETKIHDAMLYGDIKRAVASNTDVILFNIDSKADNRSGRDAILTVFLRVFNEMLGYSGDHPWIAHMERYLDGKHKLDTFHAAYKLAARHEWVDERDAYAFNRDAVVKALSHALGQSEEASHKWFDNMEKSFPLTIENFCGWVKEYLDTRGPNHRLIFLVDEMGQFVGQDTQRMLNLQTITEDLGTACGGRAWVVVTSQEDIDAVLGEMKKGTANDFSKIQGRFKTRLSLSSANVDEVIQERLLAKRGEVVAFLRALHAAKGDILKNQLSFTNVGPTLRAFKDADDFVRNYPFAPYQFQLVQKVFEAIRKVGATGLHLSRGERSILDAFQSAAKQVAGVAVGVLVPFWRFYPSIESFLDTSVKRTIDQAETNPSLEPFDIRLLQVLFLIRYVEEIKGNVNNLVTLCIDEIDADRLALRRKIEESLQRLEKETLISRSGDNYFFLTNEERDINREIKSVDLSSGEEAKLLGELIFDEVLKGNRKHRYAVNGKDFPFNCLCDLHPVGRRVETGLVVSVVSPLADDYKLYENARCILASTNEGGQILLRLNDDESLGRELRTYLKTEKYISRKNDGSLPKPTLRILHDCAEDNRDRRESLVNLLSTLLLEATYFAAGSKLTLKAQDAASAMNQALDYLIQNTFPKMGLLKRLNTDPQREIQAVLRSNDIALQTLAVQTEEANPQALDEIRGYVDLCSRGSRTIVLHEMIETRYGIRPHGWPDWEIVLLVARLVVLGEMQIVMNGAVVPTEKVYAEISAPAKWRKITIVQRRNVDTKLLQATRALGKDVFSEMGPESEEGLFTFLSGKLKHWESDLLGYKPLAETGSYPGQEEITDGLRTIAKITGEDDSFKFIERFNALKAELLELAEDYHDLKNFYDHQKPAWEKLRKASERFQLNRLELERDPKAAPALKRIHEILHAPCPYNLIKDGDGLIQTVSGVNDALVSARRAEALATIDTQTAEIGRELVAVKADASLKTACLQPVQDMRKQVEREQSLAHIAQAQAEAVNALDTAISRIETALKAKTPPIQPGKAEPPAPVVKSRCVIKPADFVNKTYLETPEDVEAFIKDLRLRLETALKNNERIQIR
ncbi:MAG: BREX system P-loop protein BrxC [Verrucomicrobia bacterium]|nr:BREX system P-loop protein BrxC [Verrucomicrobiota bacterium]